MGCAGIMKRRFRSNSGAEQEVEVEERHRKGEEDLGFNKRLFFSAMPGSMNSSSSNNRKSSSSSSSSSCSRGSKYLFCLSMAMNVLLLANMVDEKGIQNHSVLFLSLPSNLRWIWDKLHGDASFVVGGYHNNNNDWSAGQKGGGAGAVGGFCKECSGCMASHDCSSCYSGCIINLDHGDPTMFEEYWVRNGQASTTVILGWQMMSYFADVGNICWFLHPELAKEIRALHALVGNAIAQDRYIVVGTGSTQLFQAALYALSPADQKKPTKVISAAPYYSSYPVVTDYLKSEIYRWAGDALTFHPTNSPEENYIELVTSPNNPDGFTRKAVVNGSGAVIYDYAYYWPHYTPITAPAQEDIMLFTVSKSTGHAGSRIGWALVKDPSIAKRMTKFIELNTIGVSKDSQLRAAQILHSVTNSYGLSHAKTVTTAATIPEQEKRFFHHGYALLKERWSRLREAIRVNARFSLPIFESAQCSFFGQETTPQPAFAWLRCEGVEDDEDCEKFLRTNGIITRSGRHFGVSQSYVRLSIIDRSQTFDLLIDRLASLQ